MTALIQTLGPADPNAPIFAKIYATLTSLLGLIGFAQTFHLITSDQAASLDSVGKIVVSLVGAVGTAIATFRTRKQIGNGTFDKAPEPIPVISTADQIVKAIPLVVQEVADKQAELDKVKQATASIIGPVPVIGPLATEIINSIGLSR